MRCCFGVCDVLWPKPLREIELRSLELQILLDELGSRHIDTARPQFQLGSALWLSNKPLETYQAVHYNSSRFDFKNTLQQKGKSVAVSQVLVKTAHDAVSEGARDVGAVSEEVGCVNCNSVCVLHLVLVVAHGRTIRGGSKPSARHTAWDIFPTAH